MESLVPVFSGGDDIFVGVSGFGSAKLDGSRWLDAGVLTGRTSYNLSYDAQEFPWNHDGDHPGFLELASSAGELNRLWSRARVGVEPASQHLATWLSRWAMSGRRTLLVGFSLGASVVWQAIRKSPKRYWGFFDVILVSGAIADSEQQWEGADSLGSLVNVWSSSDRVLRWMYPRAVPKEETPAAGLGPLQSRYSRSLDLTDMIGVDHLWAGDNLPRVLRVALGTEWSRSAGLLSPAISSRNLDAESIERLSGWCASVPEFNDLLGAALSSDMSASEKVLFLDSWSRSSSKLISLFDASSTVSRLLGSVRDRHVADRSLVHIEGIIRRWVALSGREDSDPRAE
jgi:hypothetical protein